MVSRPQSARRATGVLGALALALCLAAAFAFAFRQGAAHGHGTCSHEDTCAVCETHSLPALAPSPPPALLAAEVHSARWIRALSGVPRSQERNPVEGRGPPGALLG